MFEPGPHAMTIYHYDEQGAFTGSGVCHAVVKGNGERWYTLPRNSTHQAPPVEVPAGRVPVYLEQPGVWITVADHRGELWRDFRGHLVRIERLGDPAKWMPALEPVLEAAE